MYMYPFGIYSPSVMKARMPMLGFISLMVVLCVLTLMHIVSISKKASHIKLSIVGILHFEADFDIHRYTDR